MSPISPKCLSVRVETSKRQNKTKPKYAAACVVKCKTNQPTARPEIQNRPPFLSGTAQSGKNTAPDEPNPARLNQPSTSRPTNRPTD